MKALLLALLSAFYFSLTYASAPAEFSAYDLFLILAILTVVVGGQSLVACLIRGHPRAQRLSLALFALANVFSLNLVLNDHVMSLRPAALVLALLTGVYVLYMLMTMVDASMRLARLLPTVVAVATVAVLIAAAPAPPTPAGPVPGESGTSADNVRLIELESRPNVYLVSFDSLWPRSLLRSHLGIADTPLNDVLDGNFRRFRNFFADHIPTAPSLNSILALDPEHFTEAYKGNRHLHFFSGMAPSPLFEVFKYNGYRTNTLFETAYLGQEKGPHVDNYWVNRKLEACELIEQKSRAYAFFGYCLLIGQKAFLSLSGRLGVIHQPDPVAFLLESIRVGIRENSPQVFVAHINSPGHTDDTFDREDPQDVAEFARSYLAATQTAAGYLRRIIDFLAREDPDALLFVYGDHGPIISRRYSFADDPVAYVEGAYGIYGGVYPRDRCADVFSATPAGRPLTILQGVHLVLRCLSGGQSALIRPAQYRLWGAGPLVQYNYEDFLYE